MCFEPTMTVVHTSQRPEVDNPFTRRESLSVGILQVFRFLLLVRQRHLAGIV